jgi:hypothetical protein
MRVVRNAIILVLLFCVAAPLSWSAQPTDWGKGRLISMKRGKIFETYEIFSGRCVFVGKKFRSFGHPRVAEGGQIRYSTIGHWLYFVDDAGKTHTALYVEQRLMPVIAPPGARVKN